MTLLRALSALRKTGQAVIRTADVMATLRVQKGHASKILGRLADHGEVTRLKRGLWAIGAHVEPMALAAHLTAPMPSYISLQSALYHHGLVSQVPATIYACSLARTCLYVTPLAAVSVHHLPVELYFGFEVVKPGGISMALPEKALVDFLYLTPARSRLFAQLPEIEFPRGFGVRRATAMIDRIPDPRRRAMVRARLSSLRRAYA
jgi:hypothetical protein